MRTTNYTNNSTTQQFNNSTIQQLNNSTLHPFEKNTSRPSITSVRSIAVRSLASFATHFFDLLRLCSLIMDGNAGYQEKKLLSMVLFCHAALERVYHLVDR
jgi:hypothetical protein